jgi:hypothetical protein
MIQQRIWLASALFVVMTCGAALAQQPQPGAQRGCVDLAAAPGQPGQPSQGPAKEPATAPDHGAQGSGTSPGSAGSTGWTGGTGGSYVGTVPSGPHAASPQAQPEVATGLNPMKSVSKRQAC